MEVQNIRINKYLATKGLCSRREADEWIKSGWIHVDGTQITEPGLKIDPLLNKVEVRNRGEGKVNRYFLLNKPASYLSTVVETEGMSILRLLPEVKGLFPIGRLDKESEGLIIVTNDRTLTKHIIGEDVSVEKEYLVTLASPLTKTAQEKIEKGLNFHGEKLKPCIIKRHAPLIYSIILTEGKNRQVRRVFQKIGNEVTHLQRTRIGDIKINYLKDNPYLEVDKDYIQKYLKLTPIK